MSETTVALLVKLKDEASDGLEKVKGKLTDLGSVSEETAKKISTIGTGIVAFSTAAVYSAATAETAWIGFGAQIDRFGGNFKGNAANFKKEVRGLADEMGRSVGEIRSTEMALMQVGLSYKEAADGAKAAAQIAAATGSDMSSVESALISAMMGRGKALQKLGFDINDYKDATTGAIDTTRLFADVQAKYGEAGKEYTESFTGQMQLLKNELAGLVTEWGQALLPAVKEAVKIVKSLTEWFKGLDPNVRSAIAVIVTFAGGFMMILYPAMKVIRLLQAFKTLMAGLELGSKLSRLAGGFASLAKTIFSAVGKLVAYTAAQLSAAFAEYAFLAPLLIIIAVIAAVTVAVYLLGKHFGWWKSPMDMGRKLLDGLKKALQGVWNWLVETGKAVWDAIGGFVHFVTNIPHMISVLLVIVQAKFNEIVATIKGFISSAIQAAIDFAKGIVDNVIAFIVTLPERILDIFKQIYDVLSGAVRRCGQIASDIGHAIWNGIINAITGIGEAIWNMLPSEIRGIFGYAGAEGLAATSVEAGTFIGSGYGAVSSVSNISHSTRNMYVVNVAEGAVAVRTDGLTDEKARKILKQGLSGIIRSVNKNRRGVGV